MAALCVTRMNKHEAQRLVEAELERTKDTYDPIDCVVLEDETLEKEWGWVFFYQSKAYVDTGDFGDMLAGNAPIIVNCNTGELVHTGAAQELEQYIKEYESTL